MKYLFVLLLLVSNVTISAQVVSLPYNSTFDNAPDTVGWTHYASYGTDNWELGTPAYGSLQSALSSPNSWKTNLDGVYSANSSMILESPYFDLSSAATNSTLAFYRAVWLQSGTTFKLEYSTNGTSWLLLNPATTNKLNWQGTGGFNTSCCTYIKSCVDISSLVGLTVKFRFILTSSSTTGLGASIDNFSISAPYYEVSASQGDTIPNVNQNFTQITTHSSFIFSNQYNQTYPFRNVFFLSNDAVLDGSDLVLDTINNNFFNGTTNYINILNLPGGLSPGTYYVFHKFDATNVLIETNESNNVHYSVLLINPVYTTNYSTDVEATVDGWNGFYGSAPSTWSKGYPNGWHVENPRSGESAWYSGVYVSNSTAVNTIETPYLNLTNTNNNTICFWYRNSSNEYYQPMLKLQIPALNGTNITTPIFYPTTNVSYTFDIPRGRHYGWDCYCKNVSQYDNQESTKFRIFGGGNIDLDNLNQSVIDDIYIGTAKSDVAIEGEKKNLYSPSTITNDTLKYLLYNSGLQTLPATVSKFYWSNDSILDIGDLLIATISEPSLGDTSFIERNFIYTKPTTNPGLYYIHYTVDSDDIVDEMREYDNAGYFEIHQAAPQTLPYFNDFESSISGWRHAATLGDDQWGWGVPSGIVLDSAYSGVKAFVTGLNYPIAPKSRMHLYTPIFDLSQLQDPVLEFDLKNNCYVYNTNTTSMGGFMYSVDGGAHWLPLYATSPSFKGFYYPVDFSGISGFDYNDLFTSPVLKGEILYQKDQPFLMDMSNYLGRDYDENHRFSLDIDFLQGKTVQFMLVYANANTGQAEGMMLDNFTLKERSVDFEIICHKKLLASSLDTKIKTFFSVKNNDNYLSLPSSLEIYCSVDSVLDASDVLIATKQLHELKPYEKQYINLYEDSPTNYGSYNYLVYSIDPLNTNLESDETNNFGHIELAMDSLIHFQYPMLHDFEQDEIDGWSWRNDSTGYNFGARFRHKQLTSEIVHQSEPGTWFLDPLDPNGYGTSINSYPTNYLESPAYDFTLMGDIHVSFDFICIGAASANNSQGGNMSYSVDGGATWVIMSNLLDPYATNWFNVSSITSLNNEPGWNHFNFTNWATAKYNLSFLSGQPNVRFRFKFKSKHKYTSPGKQGFRLDNFKIDALAVDLQASTIHPTINADINQSSLLIDYAVINNSAANVLNHTTGIYWSQDTLLDSNDQLMYQVQEAIVLMNDTLEISQSFYYPIPVQQSIYYVLYFVENDSIIDEPNEANNLGWIKVIFNDISSIDLLAIPQTASIFENLQNNYFPFEFQHKNIGNFISSPNTTEIFWSEDAVLDGSDFSLYQISEQAISPSFSLIHSGNIYYPLPILQQYYYMIIQTDRYNDQIESDETNNIQVILIDFDLTGLGIVENDTEHIRFINENDYIKLQFPNEFNGPYSIELYTVLGQSLLRKKDLHALNSILQIEKPEMISGVYFLRIENGKENKLIKFPHYEK